MGGSKAAIAVLSAHHKNNAWATTERSEHTLHPKSWAQPSRAVVMANAFPSSSHMQCWRMGPATWVLTQQAQQEDNFELLSGVLEALSHVILTPHPNPPRWHKAGTVLILYLHLSGTKLRLREVKELTQRHTGFWAPNVSAPDLLLRLRACLLKEIHFAHCETFSFDVLQSLLLSIFRRQ